MHRTLIAFRHLVILFSALCSCAPLVNAQSAPPRKHLIICVDGVGFATIEKMKAEGHYKYFRQPARMIAPFPTLTDVSLSQILHSSGAGEPPGYEDSYFDVTANKMRGGVLDRFRQDRFVAGTFRDLFDYHPSALKSGLGYAAPPFSTYLEALTDLVRLRQKFRTARGPVFFAYTGASDTLAHLGGERMLRSFLARLDDTVAELIHESGEQVEVTIFSDHGNDFRAFHRAPLKDALKRAGFRREGRVRDGRSVVLPQFGLVGSAEFWTKEENERRLAEVLAQVRGVEFAVYEQDGVVYVVGRDGEAVLEQRGESFRYRALKGDPLTLNETVNMLRSQGKVDTDGFIADGDWFTATCPGPQPDVVRRVFMGATKLVRNRANVLVNFADGYYSGSMALDFVAFLQATHGNLGRGQSLGFVMSTSRELPAYLRATDVWSAIGAPVLNKATTQSANEKR
ncbi:MAG: hypothetical protein ACJ74W_09500 [Pyrinomonadaceae bacterium]